MATIRKYNNYNISTNASCPLCNQDMTIVYSYTSEGCAYPSKKDKSGNIHNHDPLSIHSSATCPSGHIWSCKGCYGCGCGWVSNKASMLSLILTNPTYEQMNNYKRIYTFNIYDVKLEQRSNCLWCSDNGITCKLNDSGECSYGHVTTCHREMGLPGKHKDIFTIINGSCDKPIYTIPNPYLNWVPEKDAYHLIDAKQAQWELN